MFNQELAELGANKTTENPIYNSDGRIRELQLNLRLPFVALPTICVNLLPNLSKNQTHQMDMNLPAEEREVE